jgi:hypothetical protein
MKCRHSLKRASINLPGDNFGFLKLAKMPKRCNFEILKTNEEIGNKKIPKERSRIFQKSSQKRSQKKTGPKQLDPEIRV